MENNELAETMGQGKQEITEKGKYKQNHHCPQTPREDLN